jgi:TolB-like protein/DNA-binding SARP family transcriptional activator/Tfp pilus assembly protein PilF
MVRFWILGALDLRAPNGAEVRSVLAQPKRTALLAYLAVASPRGFHRRDTLLGLLWPERDQAHARAALSKAVHYLRRSLGESVVESRGDEELRVNAEQLWCDATAFRAAVNTGAFEDALALYRGDLLAGFFVDDVPEFEHWLETERAALRREAAEGAWRLAEEAAAGADTERIAGWARRGADLAPDDEAGVRRAVALLDRVGERAGALRLYGDLAERLRKEWGVEPSVETQRLVAEIRARDRELPARAADLSTPEATLAAIPAASTNGAVGATVPSAAFPIAMQPASRADAASGVAHAAQTAVPPQGRLGPQRPARRLARLIALAAVASAAVLLTLRLRLPPLAADEAGREFRASIAVLPFADLSQEPQEYFSDGITEEIIAQLSTISGLKVISRTSVMAYKGRTEELREIGGRLGVNTVLEGSVRRAGDRVRVVAQLIDARTDEHLWTQTYDWRAADIFAIQSDIAQNIARELQILLSPQARERISVVPTRSTEAYNFYLRGRYLWNKRTSEAGRQAITLFERALELDPAYARAYAALAEVYAILPFHATASISETNPRARAAALRALELDSTLAPAHAALGLAALTDWRWDEARRALRRATELDPGYAAGHQSYGFVLFAVGECSEASQQLRLARELDPLSVVIVLVSAFPHACAGDFDGALRVLREALAMDSTHQVAWRDVITLEESSGRLDRALGALQRAAPVLGIGPDQLRDLQRAYASKGAEGYWEERIKLAQHVTFVPGRAANYAQAYAAAGDRERALEWLERAYAEHEVGISLIKGSWAWRSLRDDPRFQQILRRMGLR